MPEVSARGLNFQLHEPKWSSLSLSLFFFFFKTYSSLYWDSVTDTQRILND